MIFLFNLFLKEILKEFDRWIIESNNQTIYEGNNYFEGEFDPEIFIEKKKLEIPKEDDDHLTSFRITSEKSENRKIR